MRGQGAEIVRFPIIPRRSFDDPAWREQWEREKWDAAMKTLAPPPRTRPLIVSHRPEGERRLPEQIGPLNIIGRLANACRVAKLAGVNITAFKLDEPQAFEVADWLCNCTREPRNRFEIVEQMKAGRTRLLGRKVVVKQLNTCHRPESER